MNTSLGHRLFVHAKKAGMMIEGYAWIITDYLSNFLNSMDFVARDSMKGVLGIRPYVSRSEKLDHSKKAEKIGPVNSSLLNVNTSKNGTDGTNMKISAFGPKLLSKLSNTKLRGLSGDIQLINGQLKPPAFEIFNLIGTGEKTVGFWTLDRGISRELISTGEPTYSTSTENLKNVLWPGDSVTQPKGLGYSCNRKTESPGSREKWIQRIC
ncbi:Hypothetical predicted protein [Olea europaea subsp. europaea]|uniref:Receptor ligand binding region domain-containing protein n=1 Tax=Olea europaea subsp. europaea TaxID=158383 RepID=A0A8S0SKA0_OLEEU|nr:Hypothetical predicted protein [Olea europaea subsp. europaea]